MDLTHAVEHKAQRHVKLFFRLFKVNKIKGLHTRYCSIWKRKKIQYSTKIAPDCNGKAVLKQCQCTATISVLYKQCKNKYPHYNATVLKDTVKAKSCSACAKFHNVRQYLDTACA